MSDHWREESRAALAACFSDALDALTALKTLGAPPEANLHAACDEAIQAILTASRAIALAPTPKEDA